MTQKLAFLLLNSTHNTQENSNKNWSFDDSISGLKEAHTTKIAANNFKHFLKELSCWEKITPALKQAKHLLSSENTFLSELKKHLQTYRWDLHILISLTTIKELLPLVLDALSGQSQIFIHLALEKADKEKLFACAKFLEEQEENSKCIIASLAGAQSIFNQKAEREETQKVYDEIVFNQSQTSFSLTEYLEKQFENEKAAEEIAPVSFVSAEPLEENDIFLILESDGEKIELLTQTLEVSKNEVKKSDFSDFNPIFITKPLPHLLLATIKRPYPSYEALSLVEEKTVTTLPEKIAEKESRQLYLGNPQQLKLLKKYLSNESGILVDGQKMEECVALISDAWELLQTEGEILVRTFEKQIPQFEVFFLSCDLPKEENQLLEQFITISKKEKVSFLIYDWESKTLWSHEELKLEKEGAPSLHKAILKHLLKK